MVGGITPFSIQHPATLKSELAKISPDSLHKDRQATAKMQLDTFQKLLFGK